MPICCHLNLVNKLIEIDLNAVIASNAIHFQMITKWRSFCQGLRVLLKGFAPSYSNNKIQHTESWRRLNMAVSEYRWPEATTMHREWSSDSPDRQHTLPHQLLKCSFPM